MSTNFFNPASKRTQPERRLALPAAEGSDPLDWSVEPGSSTEITIALHSPSARPFSHEYQIDSGAWQAMPGVRREDAIESLTDAFPSLDPVKWETRGTVTVSGGAARIAATGAYDGRVIARRQDWVLEGSSIRWRMSATNYRNSMVGFLVLNPAGLWQTREIRWGFDSGTLRADAKLNGGFMTIVRGDTPYSPDVHVYFRLREDARTIFYEWSTNGASWTSYASVAPPFGTFLGHLVFLMAGDWAGEAGTINISEINL